MGKKSIPNSNPLIYKLISGLPPVYKLGTSHIFVQTGLGGDTDVHPEPQNHLDYLWLKLEDMTDKSKLAEMVLVKWSFMK